MIVSRHDLLLFTAVPQPGPFGPDVDNTPRLQREPPQPLEFAEGIYNYRMLMMLPLHLVRAARFQELKDHVLGRYQWLKTKLIAKSFR